MAFYRNKVNKISLIDKLVQLLTTAPSGSTSPYWRQVQSGTYNQEGYILHSKGSSGTDDIFIRFRSLSSTGINMSLVEQYTPNSVAGLTGTIENESVTQNVSFSTSTYGDSIPVDYILSFDRDKIILALKGNPTGVSSYRQTLIWIGLPERLDPNDTSKAAVIAASRNAYQLTQYGPNGNGDANNSLGQCRVLDSKYGVKQQQMNMVVLSNAKTKGWGDTILLSHIYLQSSVTSEGIRSRMTGIHPIIQSTSTPDFRDGDEITVGSKRYTVLDIWESGSGTNCFTQKFMAIEQL